MNRLFVIATLGLLLGGCAGLNHPHGRHHGAPAAGETCPMHAGPAASGPMGGGMGHMHGRMGEAGGPGCPMLNR